MNTWTVAIDTGCQNQLIAFGGERIIYWTATAIATNANDLVQIQTVSAIGMSMAVFDISGLPILGLVGSQTSTGTCNAATTYNTGSQDYGSAAIIAVAVPSVCSSTHVIAAGTSFTMLSSSASSDTDSVGGIEYATSGVIVGPTNFPWSVPVYSGTASPWLEVGAAFGSGAPTVNSVVACTFFQLECWWYPLMFFGMYEGFFLGVAMTFRMSEKAIFYTLFSGGTIATFIEIELGIMTFLVPLMLLAILISYSFRLDRIIAGAINK